MSNTNDVFYGRVKWFNNRAGYGFITIVHGPDGSDQLGKEVFAHHSGVNVSNEQYKYLIQGEYVEFGLDAATEGEHEFQAVNISGISGGMLMCETRAEIKQYRDENNDDDGRSRGGDGRSRGGDGRSRGGDSRSRGGGKGHRGDNYNEGQRVRLMGGGARDGEIWTLVKENERGGKVRNGSTHQPNEASN